MVPINMDMLQLKSDLLALPTSQRAFLAQELWGSLNRGFVDVEESEILDEVERRNLEMSSGQVIGRTHEEVMTSLRQRLG